MDPRRLAGRTLMALGGALFLAGLSYFVWVLVAEPSCSGYLCGIGLVVTGIFIAAIGGAAMGIGLAVAPAGSTPVWLLVIVTLASSLPLLPGIMLLKDAGLTGAPSFLVGSAFTVAGLIGLAAAARDWRAWIRRLRHT